MNDLTAKSKLKKDMERPLTCFVVMPYGAKGEYDRGNIESDYIFNNIIHKAINRYIKNSGKSIILTREADKNIAGSITKSIVKQIATSDICIVDITGLNANVFFELGIRYSLKRRLTILLRQDETQIPFDISGYKCISYDCYFPDAAVQTIYEFLDSGLTEVGGVDSLVFETYPEMQIYIPGVLREIRDSTSNINTMDWDEWWTRVRQMGETLAESCKSGRFVPSVIMGISNGGLLLADIIGRTIYNGTPVVSLWADRTAQPTLEDENMICYFFDNCTNQATLQVLETQTDKNKLNILLVDDIVATGKTVRQAINFIRKSLRKNYDLVFTPLFCIDTNTLEKFKDILPISEKYSASFNLASEKEYYKRLTTPRHKLPYEKPMSSESA